MSLNSRQLKAGGNWSTQLTSSGGLFEGRVSPTLGGIDLNPMKHRCFKLRWLPSLCDRPLPDGKTMFASRPTREETIRLMWDAIAKQ